MTLDLPRPAAIREEKKRRIGALLDAQLYLPPLVELLSAGLIQLDEATTCRWAGWIDSLTQDPAWRVIKPALSTPSAWPEIWHHAREAGFSDATEHHQAIFFTRLFERTIAESDYERARFCWDQALQSWTSLSDEDYLRTVVLSPMAEELTDDQCDQVLAALLDGPLAACADVAQTSLRLHDWSSAPRRRPLRVTLEALEQAQEAFHNIRDSALAGGICEGVALMHQRLAHGIGDELTRQLESVDMSTIDGESLLTIFDGALRRHRLIDTPPSLDRIILRKGLALLWDLRELEREDDVAITQPMIDRLQPCACRLRDTGGDDLFGLQGAIADLWVFQGEEALSLKDRQAAFEEALQICPGHRNASRLLSYLLLERANRDLLKTSTMPDAGARIGAVRRRIRPLVDRIQRRVERAEQLYPQNDLLDRYREDLAGEIERFQLATEADDEDR